MATCWRVSEVHVLEDYAIRVRFVDGLEGVVRFPPDFFRGVFSHLNDPAKFREVAVSTVQSHGRADSISHLMRCIKTSSFKVSVLLAWGQHRNSLR